MAAGPRAPLFEQWGGTYQKKACCLLEGLAREDMLGRTIPRAEGAIGAG